MSDDTIAEDLDGQARALLAAYRAEEALPDDVRTRVRARIDRSVGGQSSRMPVRTEPTSGRSTRWFIVATALAAALAALWWDHDRRSQLFAEAPTSAVHAAEPTKHDTTVPSTAPVPAEPPRAIAPPPTTTVATPPAAPAIDRPAKPSARPSAAAVEVDALADETALVRAAQAALAGGDADHALALLEAGTRRFGVGLLAQERAAIRVLALCKLGRRTAARDDAAAFERAHPDSPLLARVRAACTDDEKP